MRMFERLVCNLMWLVWVVAIVDGPGARSGERPFGSDDSGAAGRCLYPNRTILPY
jgi:hypothetical protein